MKNSILFRLTILLVALLASAFVQSSFDGPQIKYLIKGVSHDLKKGLEPSEFEELRIETEDKDLKVESFQITHARGNRAIEVTYVNGNTFDLRKYTRKVRNGDRLVIEVKVLKNHSESIKPQSSIITIPINSKYGRSNDD